MAENKTPLYNKKDFLLPSSANSMASYHGKVRPDGVYKFSIHDCHNSIRLTGTVLNKVDVQEAVDKLNCLAAAATEFAVHIAENYQGK